MLASARLTHLEWPFKVKFFLVVLDHRGPFYDFFWLCCDAGNMKNRSPWIISDQEDSISDQEDFILVSFLIKKISFWINFDPMATPAVFRNRIHQFIMQKLHFLIVRPAPTITCRNAEHTVWPWYFSPSLQLWSCSAALPRLLQR